MAKKPTYEELEQRVKELEQGILRDKTEEEARGVEKAYLDQVIENSQEAIVISDNQGIITRVNNEFTKVFGYSEEESLGRLIDDLIASDEYRDEATSVTNKVARGDKVSFEAVRRRKDGTLINVSVQASPIIVGNEQVGHYGVYRDITETKRVQELLQESEEKYRTLFENTDTAMLVLEEDMTVSMANTEAEKLTGYTRAEVVGKRKWTDFVFKEDLEWMKEYHIRRRQDTAAVPSEYEFRFVDKRGDIKGVFLKIALIPGTKRSVASVTDISSRKRTEQALRKSEEKYRSILETIEDGYYEVDIAGNLTFFNDSLCRILGYPRDELMGMNNREYTDEENARKLYQTFNKVFTTGMPEKGYGWEIIRKDGTKRYIEASVSLRKDAEGRPIGFRGIARDITDKRRLEAQLHQAQRLEALGTLAGGTAHNFNNVLMAIQGRTSLMMMGKDSSHPEYEDLKAIEEAVQGAAELTKNLLGFARGGKYQVKPTDLNTIIEHENHIFGQTNKEISIHRKYAEGLWAVEVDQGQMHQVLMNLYINAWQAMPGGGDLFVETQNVTIYKDHVGPNEMAPGGYVKVSVTDTGLGMDEATREKIFEPFFTTRETGQGTGLGLSSVYGIIKNHGGFIDVYSEKGKGTTFHIYLPALGGEVEEEREQAEEVLKGEGTVLLVDDEEMITEVGKQLLERLGYEALTAESGKEAVDIYEKKKDQIDLVILDMVMPDMSGGETYDRLKEINPDIKVLLSSGYSIKGQAREILDRGCNGFIQKPFNLEELSGKLREVLDKSRP